MESEPAIVVDHLYKVFGRRPRRGVELLQQGVSKQELHERSGMTVGVEDASFEIREGETFVVMGLSGSGKSTLLRMLNRLIEPSAGRVVLHGRDVARLPRRDLIRLRREKIGMVFQSFALMPHLSVLENAAFGLKVAGEPRAERHRRALEVLERVGLSDYAGSLPRELSGGMQQRVGLARALAVDPDVLLMDEAFSALDPLIRSQMQDQVLELQQERPRTVVFVSHDLDEAMKIGDRIAIMESGRVLQVGTPEEILSRPASDMVRSFFAGVDVANVYRAGDIVRTNPLTIVDRPGEGVRVALARLEEEGRDYGYIRDAVGNYRGVVSAESLARELDQGRHALSGALIDIETLRPETELDEVIRVVTHSPCPIPVVDDAGRFAGIVSKSAVLETMGKARSPGDGTEGA
jgi:glycine betaine/proline transport system ATP-binding protein